MRKVRKFCVLELPNVQYPRDEEMNFIVPKTGLVETSSIYKALNELPHSTSPRKEARFRAVKIGFAWIGFFLWPWWLVYHRLWSKLILSILLYFAIGIILTAIRGYFAVLDVWLSINIVCVWIGWFGNEWLLKKWRKKGYQIQDVVYAVCAEEAVAKYLLKQHEEILLLTEEVK